MPDHRAPRTGFSLWNYTEPAMLRGVVAAVLALCAALGIVLPFDLPAVVEALILLFAAITPLVQGKSTREAVVSPQRADQIVAGVAGTGLKSGPA